ncbi:sn-glycerol-1-phosphate dehydrogenase [Paenibacillus sp. sptzw28]|uniref:sn-glycerol-1-phosphate dehydrogenase n=1 Tax=Paenibacillus sp. sptzw28 TaxID=715179 RepID=UPI001C6E52B7|nr:sn-glycerol-1-phosphate dehydrogenase [Paenibacillus sp. sptzw28]QYR20197.1 sn-glycerol-1-phosphate dehydrogenase [Paenibacillus sp. sptzw28]
MNGTLEKIKQAAAEIGIADAESLFPGRIVVEPGAIDQVAGYVGQSGYTQVIITADANTLQIAGQRLADELTSLGISADITVVKADRQGDVIADEASIIQVILDIQRTSADLVIAAGSGTLHDIARYAAYTTGLPFVSVPTAPSVDGFTSKGAPIIIRGEKITVPAIGPIAIFADLDILREAPGAMAAAGFGDMLGKYTSLFDWKVGRMTADEPYMPLVAEITEQALQACVQHAEQIGRRTEDGIRILIGALIDSGLAMLLFGQSHPASGAEHHLSHYWEMEYIRSGRRQLLHGAKVGVACAEITALYREFAKLPQAQRIKGWYDIRREIDKLPGEEEIRGLLRTAGGPASIGELGVDPGLLERSKREAHRVRLNRHTLLRIINELNGADEPR